MKFKIGDLVELNSDYEKEFAQLYGRYDKRGQHFFYIVLENENVSYDETLTTCFGIMEQKLKHFYNRYLKLAQ